MPRRMSCSMTKSKTHTRRHKDTWKDLKPGDHLILVEKAQGLPKGSKQVVLKEVVVTFVAVELLWDIDEQGCEDEGFPNLTPGEFCRMWMEAHGYASVQTQNEAMAIECRHIAWRYVCPSSRRVDGPWHSLVFGGDDPYVLCAFCAARWDAVTGRRIPEAPRG